MSTAFCKHCCGGAAESVGYEEGGGYQVPGCAIAHIGWVIELFCTPFYIYMKMGVMPLHCKWQGNFFGVDVSL